MHPARATEEFATAGSETGAVAYATVWVGEDRVPVRTTCREPDERTPVNPIRTATGLIQLPAHAAAAAMGTAAGIATTSARTNFNGGASAS